MAGGSLLVLTCRTGRAADDSALLNALLREGVLTSGGFFWRTAVKYVG
jgi:hypothetical protein